MQQGDFNYYYPYPQNPPPQSTSFPPHPPPASASAPPFASNYAPPPSDYLAPYPSSYPPASDPLPTAPPPQQPQPSAAFPQYETHGPYSQPTPQQQTPPPLPYSAYDQQLAAPPPNYTSSSGPNSIPKLPYDSVYSAQLNQLSSSFQSQLKFDQHGSYLDDISGRYGNSGNSGNSGRERFDLGSNFYGKSSDGGSGGGSYGMDGYGDGVFAYQGSKAEPYGARGTAPKSSTWSGFDDFGRPISFSSSDKVRSSGGSSAAKIARAVPKADAQEDVKSGVQKFRVKLLAESGGQSTMDVLCQVACFILFVFVHLMFVFRLVVVSWIALIHINRYIYLL